VHDSRDPGGRHVPYPTLLSLRPHRPEEWNLLEPLLASPERRGRPPKWPARQVADAVFYLLRSGCAWRMLPREYPPWQTVYYHFGKWRRDGRLQEAHDRLRAAVREAEGRNRNPSGAVIDSQALKGTGVGGPERGYDGAKRLSGRKRHLLVVDTSGLVLSGLVLGARVHAASVHDHDGAQGLLTNELKKDLPRLELVWAEGAYHKRIPPVGRGRARLARRGAVPSRPAALALRIGGEAAGLSSPAEEVGSRENLRVAWAGA
jgi:transposase